LTVSVVIPTFNREAALAETLSGLAAQDAPEGAFEVVVVDNGSRDGTGRLLLGLASSYPVELKVVHERTPGPAAARNAGVEASKGSVVLFLGDDTTPADSSVIRGHLDLHAGRPEPTYAVLGRVTWRPDRPITPLMRWLENGGPQFQFWKIGPGPVPISQYLYTAHLSVKRELLATAGEFSEAFPHAALEDMELGVRLEKLGGELEYHPELLVLHDHPISLERSLRRMALVGRSAHVYQRLHPDYPHPGAALPRGVRWVTIRVLAPLARLLARLWMPDFARRRTWEVLHMDAYRRGYASGPSERGSGQD
jgi:glycosyltransferase involved in cell wall biosynthesis